MSDYNPDKWVVVKITQKDVSPIYKVFASWYGGYAGCDSWKLNSGVTEVTLEGFVYSFVGYSGSVYRCHKDLYGTNLFGSGVLQNMVENGARMGAAIDILPEETNWLKINYN
jgi:hypothetical protein